MKWIFATTVLLIILAFSPNAQTKRKKYKTPPGTVKLNDSLFIDATEVANIHWREFLAWHELIAKDSVAYQKNLPDTTVWQKAFVIETPFQEYYFRHPAYNYYPLVGVTYEQVVEFCKWRSDRVNELFEKQPKLNPFPNKKYRYRLPTEEEWILAAKGNLALKEFPFGFKAIVDNKGRKLANTKNEHAVMGIAGSLNDYAIMTASIKSFYKNSVGCYNMIGNVSEMVVEKGIAKGGNFLLPLDSCKIILQQTYTQTEPWLGFRCICEIVN